MRKIVVVLSTVVMLLLSSVSTNALNVELVMSDDSAYVNRTFDVNVVSDEASFISGGMFTLSYDSSVVEFKGVSSECFDVEYNDCDDSVKVAFVLSDTLCNDDEMLNLKFKGRSEAKTNVQIVSSEIVDRDLATRQTLCSCDVSVNKKDVSSKNVSSKNATLDEIKNEATADNVATSDSYSVSQKSSDKNQSVLYILSGIVAVAVAFINVRLLLKKGDRQKF